MYNLSGLDGATNIYEITMAVNSVTDTFLFQSILGAIFIISFFVMKRYETNVAFVASSFITTMVGVGFFFLEFIGIQGLIIPIIMLLAAVIAYLFSAN